MKLVSKITKRTAALISEGAKCVGFRDAYGYIEESLCEKEAHSVKEFCKWLDINQHKASMELPFIESNYPNLYKNHFLSSVK